MSPPCCHTLNDNSPVVPGSQLWQMLQHYSALGKRGTDPADSPEAEPTERVSPSCDYPSIPCSEPCPGPSFTFLLLTFSSPPMPSLHSSLLCHLWSIATHYVCSTMASSVQSPQHSQHASLVLVREQEVAIGRALTGIQPQWSITAQTIAWGPWAHRVVRIFVRKWDPWLPVTLPSRSSESPKFAVPIEPQKSIPES